VVLPTLYAVAAGWRDRWFGKPTMTAADHHPVTA
jgi:hypothetical protein